MQEREREYSARDRKRVQCKRQRESTVLESIVQERESIVQERVQCKREYIARESTLQERVKYNCVLFVR